MFGNGIQFEGSTYLIIIEIYGSKVEIDPHTSERCFLPTDSFIDSSDWMSTLDGKSVLFHGTQVSDANVISFSSGFQQASCVTWWMCIRILGIPVYHPF